MGEIKEIIRRIRNIFNKYQEQIGEIGTPEYNELLDDICSDLLDVLFDHEV